MDDLVARGMLPEATESQYGYLCTDCLAVKDINTIGTLFRWVPIDSAKLAVPRIRP